MKKLVSVLLAAGLIFSPIGGTVVNTVLPAKYEQVSDADARGYRSPVRSFKSNNNGINRSNVNRSQSNNMMSGSGKNSFFNGKGFMGGLMMGGLAGLLFGGLLGNMGAFGNIFGLIINVLAIFLVIRLLIFFFQKWRNRGAEPAVQSTRGSFNSVKEPETIQAATETREQVLDEGNISNAVIAFFTNAKGLSLDDVQVALTYDDKAGFGADVIENDRVIQSLDHFSLIQAIRYWAEHFAGMDPNMGLTLEYSDRDGIYAVVTE
ncbi:hypothetical protein MFLO_12826 [Listeria floridensis FSL S10-1187]|uniref:Tim44-like domain-containing protein n=1 Tax=Listeria floridensis FSL S10-1187 TaxID=1265817 RepID=A0ABP3AVN0_9LIST|nr:DUF2653 family protein [Listeria floridensis]EUJ28044.1 hypothetical protein MFLO_12826 [Listeria floridensis FSL S10-1187]